MTKVNFKPNADRVLIEIEVIEVKSAAGLIIPDSAKEKSNQGIVVAVGCGDHNKPITVNVGDRVLYEAGAMPLTIDGKEYLLMRNSNIIGTI